MSNTLNGNLTHRTNLIGSLSSSSGSGGTSNYNDLDNKPSINDVTLSGNKTTSELGLFSGSYDDLSDKPTIPEKFTDLEDVNIGDIPTGWLLRFGVIMPGEPVRYEIRTGYPDLNMMNNVDINNVQNGDLLIYDSNTSNWVNKKLYTDYEATLTAGNTTVTISNAAITGNETIDIYTNVFGVNPTNIVASSGSIVLTFPVQTSDISVKVRLS